MNLAVKDANGVERYIAGSGAGTDLDPFVATNRINNNLAQQALIYKSLSLEGASPVTDVNRNMAVDGSGTLKHFLVQPPAGQIWQLTRMVFMIRDGGSFDTGGWGNNGGNPLTNGMTVGLNIGGQEYNKTPVPWTSHSDLAAVAYDLAHHNWGSGDEFVVMRLTFSKAGQNIRLVGDDGDHLFMNVNDDLTNLKEQRCMVQGFIENVYL